MNKYKMTKKDVAAAVSALMVLLALIAIPIVSPGCKTVSASDGGTNSAPVVRIDPEMTSDAIRIAVAAAVPFAIEKDTNSIPYLRAAAIVLNAAADAGNYDPAQLQASLDHISVKELRSAEARAGINAAFAIYRAYAGKAVDAKLSQDVWVKPVLKALADGISAGLPPVSQSAN